MSTDLATQRFIQVQAANMQLLRVLTDALVQIAAIDPHHQLNRNVTKDAYLRENKHWEDAFNLVWASSARSGETARDIARNVLAEANRITHEALKTQTTKLTEAEYAKAA